MTDPTSTPPTQKPAETFAGKTRAEVQALRQEHGADRIKTLTVPLPDRSALQVILRAPERLEYDRYNETLAKLREGKVAQAFAANRTLVITCTLAPGTEALTAALDRYPALADKLVEKVLEMAGADVEVREETF